MTQHGEVTTEYATNVGSRRLTHYALKRSRTQTGTQDTRNVTYCAVREIGEGVPPRTQGIAKLATWCNPEYVAHDVNVTRSPMNTRTRSLIALCRDSHVRGVVQLAIARMRENGQKESATLDYGAGSTASAGKAWKGLTSATTARHSARWSSGVKQDKVRANERTSLRDAVDYGIGEYLTMKEIPGVGVATQHGVTPWQYAGLIAIARTDRSRCALTVRQSRCAFATWARGEHVSVKPVSDYVTERETRKTASRDARKSVAREITSTAALMAQLIPSLSDARANAQGIA